MKKAIIYIRASTNEDLQKNSFGTQQAEIDRFVSQNGYEVVGAYKEYVSASKKAKRPQWEAALTHLNEDQSLTLIAWELTRVSRDLADWAVVQGLIHRLRFTNRTDEPMSFIELSMTLVMAQYETIRLGERIKAGINRKRLEQEDFCWGNAHKITNEQRKAGQDANKKNADDHQYRLKQELTHVRGLPLARQADFLNTHTTFRTRRGKKWTTANLHRALNR